MDVFSHGLWAGAVYKALKLKTRKTFSVKWAVFWGVFPDLFAFAVPLLGLLWNLSFKGISLADIPGPSTTEPPPQDSLWMFTLATALYNLSHSLIIFTVLFAIVYLIFRRPIWELGAWVLHIIIDVPTHSYEFYPTPLFWPISSWKFDGFSWANPWFLLINYAAILIVFLFLRAISRGGRQP
ncbi:MAG: metal-dependent hydrolase [Candidatus Doudnabacteria bacterium]|nr:metal-dependent hydrolase [Candidatus Doudnabacteria bacterium]